MTLKFPSDQRAVSATLGTVLGIGIVTTLAIGGWVLYSSIHSSNGEKVNSGGLATFTTNGYVVTLTGPMNVPLDRGGELTANIDGVASATPLASISNLLSGAKTWHVGETICVAGAPPCLFGPGSVIGVTVRVPSNVVFTLPPLQFVEAGASFLIQPNGGVAVVCAMPANVRIVGTAITQGAGGPTIPVTAALSTNGHGPFSPLFGGGAVSAGMVFPLTTAPAGSILGVQGHAAYGSFSATYDSFSGSDHVQTLKDGDAAPAYAPFDHQQSLASFLSPYVNTGSHTITLGPNEAIVLYEFTSDLNSSAADFQDLVVLFQFQSATC